MDTAIPSPPPRYPWQCPLFRLFSAEEASMFFNTYKCQNIGPGELHDMVQTRKDFLLLDVRTPREYTGDAIENSTLIPLQELEHRVQELPRDKEIVVYCRVGNRSAYACAYLARLGYRVKNLEGGITLWNRAGHASMSRV